MEDDQALDLLSDLPVGIIECILSRMPIRDAVKTSILSSKWRYKWSTITKLIFNEKCVPLSDDQETVMSSLINFITRVLFLHQGPIHKFEISTSTWLQSCPDIDQWILFLSRNDLKELVLVLGDGGWFRVPSSLFSCQKLTLLELYRCELNVPPTFGGFSCLKSLILHQVAVDSNDEIECLIAECPLLESLSLSYITSVVDLNIFAPNLKYLVLEGDFEGVWLQDTPNLLQLSVVMYMCEESGEQFEQASCCNFEKLLGGVPSLESLVGHVYFTKFLSIGNNLEEPSIMFSNLKNIELYQVSLEDITEIQILLRLIMNSPSLQELHISGSSNPLPERAATDLDFWEKHGSSVCTFKYLRTVNITNLYFIPHEMELIKLLLAHSPALEAMYVQPNADIVDERLNMAIELARFRRASPLAEVLFSLYPTVFMGN